MSSPFARATEQGLKTALQAAGEEVVYRRGDQVSYLRAIPGKSSIDITANIGSVEFEAAVDVQDFLFRVEDLVFGQQPFLPEEGDLLEYQGQQYRVEVLGTEVFRFMDPSKTTIRVHTVRQ